MKLACCFDFSMDSNSGDGVDDNSLGDSFMAGGPYMTLNEADFVLISAWTVTLATAWTTTVWGIHL